VIRKISPRVVEVILLIGIVSIAGFFLRGQPPVPLRNLSDRQWADACDSSTDIDVNVDVTPHRKSDWILEIAGTFAIRSLPDRKILYQGTVLKPIRIVHRNHRWSFTPSPQGLSLPAGKFEITTDPGKTFRLDRHRYRGSLVLTTTASGRPVLVNRVGLEDYVASVVDGEMPLEFGREARCSQAVIARSFVLYQRRQALHKRLPYDVHADTRSQFYPGFQYQGKNGNWFAGESPEGRACAERTRGLVCADHGSLVCTYYSAICGGRTCRGTELFPDASPLLTGVTCEHCREAPLYRWEKTLQLSRFQARLQSFLRGKGAGTLNWKSWKLVPDGERLPLFRISDKSTSYSLTGLDLRNIWGGDLLPSPIIEIELQDNRAIIRGSGHGHGVGLCQWGARGLSAQGKNFREILSFYYPGVQIVPYGTLKTDPSIASGNAPSRNGSQVRSPR